MFGIDPVSWVASFVSNLLARVFKDWRRDEELKDKGRLEQREENRIEDTKRRDEADRIKRVRDDDVTVEDNEL